MPPMQTSDSSYFDCPRCHHTEARSLAGSPTCLNCGYSPPSSGKKVSGGSPGKFEPPRPLADSPSHALWDGPHPAFFLVVGGIIAAICFTAAYDVYNLERLGSKTCWVIISMGIALIGTVFIVGERIENILKKRD